MIAKGKAISHGANAIKYAMREDKMKELIACNGIEGLTPAEIIKEMEQVNQYSNRCKNKYLHFQIGIAPQDVNKISHDKLIKLPHAFAKRMGLQDNQ